MLLSTIALVVVLGSACQSPTAPVPPFPAPTLTNYHLSGIVTDEGGSPVANAQLTLDYNSFQKLTTSTDAHGHYDLAFASSASIYDGNWGVAGVLYYTAAATSRTIRCNRCHRERPTLSRIFA